MSASHPEQTSARSAFRNDAQGLVSGVAHYGTRPFTDSEMVRSIGSAAVNRPGFAGGPNS